MDEEEGFAIGKDLPETYSLNYKNIAEAEWISPTIRLLAIDIQKNPYFPIGEWFRKLSNTSVAELQMLAESVADGDISDHEEAIEQLMLLSQMLAYAESTDDTSNLEYMQTQLKKLITLITVISLERKGFVRVFHENLTLGADMEDARICERI